MGTDGLDRLAMGTGLSVFATNAEMVTPTGNLTLEKNQPRPKLTGRTRYRRPKMVLNLVKPPGDETAGDSHTHSLTVENPNINSPVRAR